MANKYFRTWSNPLGEWEHNNRLYAVTHNPDANYPWVLNFADGNGNGGGGSPFKTREEMEHHMGRLGLPQMRKQLTLGI